MEPNQAISAAEVERMMKLQYVILKAMAKKISWLAAAEIAGASDRTMRRLRQRYQEFGYTGLFPTNLTQASTSDEARVRKLEDSRWRVEVRNCGSPG